MSRLLSELYQLKGFIGMRPLGFTKANRAVGECVGFHHSRSQFSEHVIYNNSIDIIDADEDNIVDYGGAAGITFIGCGMFEMPELMCTGFGILAITGLYSGLAIKSKHLIDQAYANSQISIPPVESDSILSEISQSRIL